MELQIFNQQYLSNLQRIHDLTKHHPFRISFSENDIATYKTLLYDLTEVWADIIYRSEYQDPKDTLQLRKFGFWIHDYRQVLSRGQKKAFPMGWFDYFEQMLQVTHVFLSTGCIDYFYNPDTLSDKDGTKIMKSEKYEWITSKKCGIDANFLPMYLPVTSKFVTDQEEIKKTMHKYNFKKENIEEKFKYWEENILPVLKWINEKSKQDLYHWPVCSLLS